MYKNIDNYLNELKKELKNSDPALAQDALSDAEEHLRTAFNEALQGDPSISKDKALLQIIQDYGTPIEIASAYQDLESQTGQVSVKSKPTKPGSRTLNFFSILINPRAWKALLYLTFSLTGIIYGIGAITGLMLAFITPVTILFFLSIRGVALMEGRIVEALLGVRMPRKPLFMNKNLGWVAKFKVLITDKSTWKTFAYMLIQAALGLFYFTLILILLAVSMKMILYPILGPVFDRSLISFTASPYFPPWWMIPLVFAAGCFLAAGTMHIARSIGKIHGRYAKFMLVKK